MIRIEALGYGSTPIRARQGRKGSFHGMHGHENAVRKRKLIPETPEHPVADVLASGGRLTESVSAATAVAFDPSKHPRAQGGKFGAKNGPPVGHAAPAQSDSAAQGSAVTQKIRANDPQVHQAIDEKQTTAFAQEHPAWASARRNRAPPGMAACRVLRAAHGLALARHTDMNMEVRAMEKLSSTFESEAWDGDYDELRQWIDRLATDVALCERTFASKIEAFTAGLYVGERELVTPEGTAQ